ncbi:MAG: hypothetical protein ACRD4P_17575, partial [Bryobacteraceae bacterium]
MSAAPKPRQNYLDKLSPAEVNSVRTKERWHQELATIYDETVSEEARTGQLPPLAVIFMDVN